MSEQNVAQAARPSLRVASLSIENFRTFRKWTTLDFPKTSGAPDALITFHGDNGSGKSNAIAALSFLFRSSIFLLEHETKRMQVRWDDADEELTVSYRDLPTGARRPMVITAHFADPTLKALTVKVSPAGSAAELELTSTPDGPLKQLRTWIETPFGSTSRPIAVLSAARKAAWLDDQKAGEPIQPALAEALLESRLSRDPKVRARWRDFEAALQAIPAFAGMDISIDRRLQGGDPELTFERRNEIVLGLEELSSGERQLVILFGAVLLANAPIIAIEEPELSLDAKSQQLFRNFLQDLVQKRRIDQAIIESHVAAFDGPNVIRFQRDPGGATTVSRAPSESAESAALTKKAKEQGADRAWVSRDGYTELPENMRKDLQLMQGGGLWFLKGERWEAWPDRDVNQMLGGDDTAEPDRE